jgi:hypothetical protein
MKPDPTKHLFTWLESQAFKPFDLMIIDHRDLHQFHKQIMASACPPALL